MRVFITALALGLAVASPALAQEASEDWDLTTNTDQQLTLATLDFGENVLALRCRAGALDLLLTGVPVPTGETRRVRVSAGAIAAEDQIWTTQPGQPVVGASEPDRLARQLRAGGELDLRLEPEDAADRPRRFRLTAPTSTRAVNAVLTACGQPLDEPRDLIARVPAGAGPLWKTQIVPEFPPQAEAADIESGVVRLGCIVGANWKLTDCRPVVETPPGYGFGASATRAANGAEMSPPADGTDSRGRLLHFTVRFAMP